MSNIEEMKKYWWSMFGIMVEEAWDLCDRRRRFYTIWVPQVDGNGDILGFKHEYCQKYTAYRASDVRRIINSVITRDHKKALAASMDKMIKEYQRKVAEKAASVFEWSGVDD